MKRELKSIGKSAYASIVEMVEALRAAKDSDEDATQAILEDALSVEVRSGWHSPGDLEAAKPDEFCLLLGTGGPAVRIVGSLSEHCEPASATLEIQDWGTPWTPYHQADEDVLLRYASCFYFGE